jgi:hypothetical protein
MALQVANSSGNGDETWQNIEACKQSKARCKILFRSSTRVNQVVCNLCMHGTRLATVDLNKYMNLTIKILQQLQLNGLPTRPQLAAVNKAAFQWKQL